LGKITIFKVFVKNLSIHIYVFWGIYAFNHEYHHRQEFLDRLLHT
jgi:hypothetical protein